MSLRNRSLAAVLALAVLPLLARTAAGEQFADAARQPDGAFLLTRGGDVYWTALAGPAPQKRFTLSDAAGHPYRFSRRVRTFARWHSEWLAADGTAQIVRFRADGVLAGIIDTPFRAGKLFVAGGRLWALSILAASPADQLWFSDDGKRFTAAGGDASHRFESPNDNLILVGGNGKGDVFVAPIIGPPVLQRVWPAGKRRRFELAYGRTRGRATLEKAEGTIEDATPYSQPVRDFVAGDSGDLIVLRNLEDVRNGAGRLERIRGRRVDHYDPNGRHLATASFPASMRWILAATPTEIRGLTESGTLASAPWGKPQPGEVWQP